MTRRISSLTDIRTYVDDVYTTSDDADREAIVEAIQNAGHPAYGTDWTEWLDQFDGWAVVCQDPAK